MQQIPPHSRTSFISEVQMLRRFQHIDRPGSFWLPHGPMNSTHSGFGEATAGNGFSFVELQVVIAVICILAVMAIPEFTRLARANRLQSESQALLSLLMLARSEAAKRVQQVVFCKSSAGHSCNNENQASWSQGAVLFVDADNDRVLDSSEELIHSETPLSTASRIGFNGGNALVYYHNGTSSGGTFTITHGDLQKKVIVSLAGRARIE